MNNMSPNSHLQELSEYQQTEVPEWMGTAEEVNERISTLKNKKIADIVGGVFFGALAIGVASGSIAAIPEFFPGMKTIEVGLLSLASGLNILTAIHKTGLVNTMKNYLTTIPQSDKVSP